MLFSVQRTWRHQRKRCCRFCSYRRHYCGESPCCSVTIPPDQLVRGFDGLLHAEKEKTIKKQR
ncbi:hypothetical protein ACHAXR_010740 [Thalassiosira sp. AJA248-18]